MVKTKKETKTHSPLSKENSIRFILALSEKELWRKDDNGNIIIIPQEFSMFITLFFLILFYLLFLYSGKIVDKEIRGNKIIHTGIKSYITMSKPRDIKKQNVYNNIFFVFK